MTSRTIAILGLTATAVGLVTFWAAVACWIVGNLHDARLLAFACVASIVVVVIAARLDHIR